MDDEATEQLAVEQREEEQEAPQNPATDTEGTVVEAQAPEEVAPSGETPMATSPEAVSDTPDNEADTLDPTVTDPESSSDAVTESKMNGESEETKNEVGSQDAEEKVGSAEGARTDGDGVEPSTFNADVDTSVKDVTGDGNGDDEKKTVEANNSDEPENHGTASADQPTIEDGDKELALDGQEAGNETATEGQTKVVDEEEVLPVELDAKDESDTKEIEQEVAAIEVNDPVKIEPETVEAATNNTNTAELSSDVVESKGVAEDTAELSSDVIESKEVAEDTAELSSDVVESKEIAQEVSKDASPSAEQVTPDALPKASTLQHRIPARAAIKVIKGEIHNVLTVLRDQRYVSRSRFTQELVSGLEDDEDLNSTSHPVAQALQDLHKQVTAASEIAASKPEHVIDVDYLEPFCQAIERREISAIVTGKALGSLHKFVLYGFVSPSSSSISYRGNKEPLGAMTRVADALLSCTFEESSAGSSNGGIDGDGGDGSTMSLKPVGNRSLAHLRRRKASAVNNEVYDDEQTVLKLLDLAALLVRTAMQDDAVHLIKASTISRLLDTCLHVSHRANKASPLLKSAASSALSQIVLQVFAAPGHQPVMQARKEIMEKLASLLNPKRNLSETKGGESTAGSKKSAANGDSNQAPSQVNHIVVTNALTLVNIALETCHEPLTPDEVKILQNDVCRYLLQWSHSSHDLMLLSLTLRVIFNLFQSIGSELKVPLEVFLTSIHMRIINDDTCMRHSPEEREVALESLVEFCQEPDLLQDIYLNYDCDVACSNLFEAIVTALGKAATPVGVEDVNFDMESHNFNEDESVSKTSVTASDEGERNLGRGKSSRKLGMSMTSTLSASTSTVATAVDPAMASLMSPVTHLHRLAMEGLLSVLDSIAKRCKGQPMAGKVHSRSTSGAFEGDARSLEGGFDGRHITTEEFHERKRRKHALVKVARSFNSPLTNSEWLDLAVKEGVLKSKDSVEGVAEILFTASMLDKAKVGIYLSKGPDDVYPFNAAVRQAFVARYDFSELTFAAALRKFLSKFRLPGEAQCIDRIMESFSKELYKQLGDSSILKNADAAFVLAFSTIMLNTDLHNPMIKEENRMTEAQFIKNNRGINDGQDLPEVFLRELYMQIKDKQIEVRQELGDMIKHQGGQEDFRSVWDNMISKKGEVATPFFTQGGNARLAGFHDKEMFIGLATPAIQALSGVFQRSWDDSLVIRALEGLRSLARVAVFFDCDSILDDILEVILPMGTDYIMASIVSSANGRGRESAYDAVGSASFMAASDFDFDDEQHPIPFKLLCSYKGDEEADIRGSAYHRGLLALNCGFLLVRQYFSRIEFGWSAYIECICALRDARALPGEMTELDDFADSSGNVLPISTFAKTSKKRLDGVYNVEVEEKTETSRGWLRSIFKRRSIVDGVPEITDKSQHEIPLSRTANVLLEIAESSEVEMIVQLNIPHADVKRKIELQLDSLDDFPFKHDPVGEQHAIFNIELATRALLSHREQALNWFTPFLNKFELILSTVTANKVPAPFVIERIVVTILRCCIHLFDVEEMRGQLKASLHLVIMTLPKNFIRVISDRMACGMAIVLRNSYHIFESSNDWNFLGDTLDMLAHFNLSRVLIFDGIASTVEYMFSGQGEEETKADERPCMTIDAGTAFSKILIRYVLGFYQGDTSLIVPGLLCLEKVYRHMVELILSEKGIVDVEAVNAAPDEELFQNMAVATYSVCRAVDEELSTEGAKCFRRVVIRTQVDQIADDKWLDVLYLMANKQPPALAAASRGNTFSLLGQIFAHVIPHLSHNAEVREDLVDVLTQFAELARENLREGRRGKVSPLFEKTLQTVTYLSNLMMTDEWTGEAEFSSWASDTLLAELERVGAAGASLQNQQAVMPKQTAADEALPNLEATTQGESLESSHPARTSAVGSEDQAALKVAAGPIANGTTNMNGGSVVSKNSQAPPRQSPVAQSVGRGPGMRPPGRGRGPQLRGGPIPGRGPPPGGRLAAPGRGGPPVVRGGRHPPAFARTGPPPNMRGGPARGPAGRIPRPMDQADKVQVKAN